MRPISFNQAGRFGVKPKIHPALEKQEEIKEETVSDQIEEAAQVEETQVEESSEENVEQTIEIETESFICPKCNKEFPKKNQLNGHMLKYTKK